MTCSLPAFTTTLRRSRRGCARAGRCMSSARATPPGKRRCSSRSTREKLRSWCVAVICARACPRISAIGWRQIREIEVRYHTQVTAIEGTEHIGAVHLRDEDGNVAREETTGLFIFIGAKPRTDFLPAELARDDKGFALTGSAVAKLASWKEQRLPEALETSLPGVFASGDCRSGTTKRVAFAIGDGALAVSCVHNLLGIYATRRLDVLNKTSVDRSDAESH